jgi:hypothetical protein
MAAEIIDGNIRNLLTRQTMMFNLRMLQLMTIIINDNSIIMILTNRTGRNIAEVFIS